MHEMNEWAESHGAGAKRGRNGEEEQLTRRWVHMV